MNKIGLWSLFYLSTLGLARLAVANCERMGRLPKSELYFSAAEKKAYEAFPALAQPGEHWYRRGLRDKLDQKGQQAWRQALEAQLLISRSYRRMETMKPTAAIQKILQKAAVDFQRGYTKVFGRQPGIDIGQITYFVDSSDRGDLADGVSRQTFVYAGWARKSGKLNAVIQHEALHLLSPGFSQMMLEEASLEFVREKMHAASTTSKPFRFISEDYNDWRLGLVFIFKQMPDLETALLEAFRSRAQLPFEKSYVIIAKH